MVLLLRELTAEHDHKRRSDTMGCIVEVLRQTEYAGIMRLRYGIVASAGRPGGGAAAGAAFGPLTCRVIENCLVVLDNAAVLKLDSFQAVMGGEAVSQEVAHVVARLLAHFGDGARASVLHELILLIGRLTMGHAQNQELVQAGGCATILPVLCALPFPYFSQPQLKAVLFPTLIASCFGNERNTQLLRSEMNCSLLVDFIVGVLEAPPGADPSGVSERFGCARRFPHEQLEAARAYFA